jgi:hypothetical protein
MTWGDATALLVSAAGLIVAIRALLVSRQAAKDARQAPVKHAQREVRAQVREHAESLLVELRSLRSEVKTGNMLRPVPAPFTDARAALDLLAPRLIDPVRSVQLASVMVQTVAMQWSSTANDEARMSAAEKQVATWTANARADGAKHGEEAAAFAQQTADEYRAEVTALERARADKRASVREACDEAISQLEQILKQLNAADLTE